ncbi:MAG TPA: glutamate synthase subunit beta [Chloroflexota bacterium]
MGDPSAFKRVPRVPSPKRPVSERIRDYRHVYHPLPLTEVRTEASRCMDCGVPFCNTGCPVGNLIPDWNDLVYRDQWRTAIDRLHLTNNFPEFTGLLCPAPCEAACVLAPTGHPVAIKEVELAIIERAFSEEWIAAAPPDRRTGKRVAVVGSGPAGLAAAQQLNRAGHRVVVFEKDDKPGGLLRYGIPDFKIEKWVIDRRVELLQAEGIEFQTNTYVGEEPTAEELGRGFDAVVLAVGALQGRDLPVTGRSLQGIHMAMDYLIQQNRRVAGLPVDPNCAITARGKNVLIIGGGDTSADCLGNVHREGAQSVQVLTHGDQPPSSAGPLEWPDWPFVLRTYPAHEEGGERRWNVAITGFSGHEGGVEQVHVQEVRRLPDSRLQHVPGTETVIEADLVLLAIGFEGPVRDRLLDDFGITFGARGAIEADARFQTVPRVYVAGDARRGASLIVWAIAEGRKAAREIDRVLQESPRHMHLPRGRQNGSMTKSEYFGSAS